MCNAMRRFRRIVRLLVGVLLLVGVPLASAGESQSGAAEQRAATPRASSLLEFGSSPVTIVCLGDSVTGVYYHTGGGPMRRCSKSPFAWQSRRPK